MKPKLNERNFADDIFKYIFLNANYGLFIQIWLRLVVGFNLQLVA